MMENNIHGENGLTVEPDDPSVLVRVLSFCLHKMIRLVRWWKRTQDNLRRVFPQVVKYSGKAMGVGYPGNAYRTQLLHDSGHFDILVY